MGLGNLFKKKTNDLDLGLDMSSDPLMNNPSSNPVSTPFPANEPSGFDSGHSMGSAMNLSNMNMQGFREQQGGGGDIQKDLQIISLKLDSIKSELDAMNQRLRNLEHIAEKEQQPQKKWY